MSGGRPATYRLALLGGPQTGKTALALQFCNNQFVKEYDGTIEDSHGRKLMVDQEICNLQILDTAGDENYQHLREQWIRDSEGFVLVYSTTSLNSFNSIAELHERIQEVKKPTIPIPIILVGNKSDLINMREVSVEKGIDLAKRLGCTFAETSARTGSNVPDAFTDVSRKLCDARSACGGGAVSQGVKPLGTRGTRRGCVDFRACFEMLFQFPSQISSRPNRNRT